MNTRLLYSLLIGALLAAVVVATTLPASAQLDGVTGKLKEITCPVNGKLMTPAQCEALKDSLNEVAPKPSGGGGGGGGGTSGGGDSDGGTSGGGGGGRADDDDLGSPKPTPKPKPQPEPQPRPGGGGGNGGGGGGNGGGKKNRSNRGGGGGGSQGGGGGGGAPKMRNSDGSPARSNPSMVDTLPSPSNVRGVPNFIVNKFRVPVFLLSIYQAAGTQYGVDWEVLAAVNEIETDYGRNLNVSTAGAVGWMQFLPSTWRAYGVDANKDGKADPYNPVDAIFAAARYLKASGYKEDKRKAIFAYNHADWYVDSVMMRARLIRGIPSDLTGSLTGLTEGRFPYWERARYADDLAEKDAERRIKRGQNAARVEESDPSRRSIEIFTRRGAPIVATHDGEVQKIGESKRLGKFIVVQDVYGNQYTYAGLDSVARFYPVPKNQPKFDPDLNSAGANDPRPSGPATAGRTSSGGGGGGSGLSAQTVDPPEPQRLFANPDRPNARRAGGLEQLLEAGLVGPSSGGGAGDASFTEYGRVFTKAFGLNAEDSRAERLKNGSRVVAGTILGRVGKPDADKAPHLEFAIRPAGRGAPQIDPKPILDGWKLLEETAIYRANGRNVLQGGSSIGQLMLMSKPLLQKRILADSRIDIYPCGRSDIRRGDIDRRVLILLGYLSQSGLRPEVSSLKCGHSRTTTSGNVSNHWYGSAVDIARINGTPILGHQDRGGVTEQTVKRILQLQGTMQPDELISLLDLGGPSFEMADHDDHIHAGYRPLFGANKKAGKQALRVLDPDQWHNLMDRLGEIEQPNVRTKPSRFATRASRAHRGE